MKGWILDLYPDFDKGKMTVWLRGKKRCYRLKEDYKPTFYVRSDERGLKKIKNYYDERDFSTNFVKRKTDIYSDREEKILSVTPQDLFDPKDQLDAVRFFEGFERYRFYNVDIPLDQRFLIENEIKPFSLVKKDNGWRSLEVGSDIHYSKPQLRKASLNVEVKSTKFRKKDDDLKAVTFNGQEIVGDETSILKELNDMLEKKDPDIILTSGGNSFDIPYLVRKAGLNGVELKLGREKTFHPPRKGSWYESYGKVIYKPPFYPLKGRIHIDTKNSFLYREGKIDGLIEASRISKVPIQRLSRRSPGSLINAMEVERALKDGYLIPWKKNISEDFKDSIHLLRADRGGHIFEPKVGFHTDVIKLDFASMYPSIINEYNLSPETLGCSCNDHYEVPELGYLVCKRRRGMIPKVVAPLIERRQKYKGLKDKNEFFEKRSKVLKWLLVTCFGYTGYKKARFNSIEVHESITAYGREILVEAAEIAQKMDFEVIHGIVDSLWLKGDREKIPDLLEKVKRKTKLELEYEGIYDWVVFPKNKSDGVGALNHYYGVFEGEIELKGLYAKRSDTPEYFKEVQREILKELRDISKEEDVEQRFEDLMKIIEGKRRELMNREVDPKKLSFTKTSSKRAEDYQHMTEMKSALTQYENIGYARSPGQTVAYVVTDSESSSAEEKVKVMENDPQLYDTSYYVDYLYRVVEEVLAPFENLKMRGGSRYNKTKKFSSKPSKTLKY